MPFEFAGKTLYVSPEMHERLMSPDGWGGLTVDELAEVGILPGVAVSGAGPITGFFRPDED